MQNDPLAGNFPDYTLSNFINLLRYTNRKMLSTSVLCKANLSLLIEQLFLENDALRSLLTFPAPQT
jgi:hypothetical protein